MADDLSRLGALIRQLQGAIGGKTRTVGANTVTISASTNSATKTVTHGLGTTPVSVQATGRDPGNGLFFEAGNFTSTTFDVVGWHPAGAVSATYNFTWEATG